MAPEPSPSVSARAPAAVGVLIFIATSACGSRPAGAPSDAGAETSADAAADAAADLSEEPDAGRDGADGGCSGSAPMCTFGCGGDAFQMGSCADGAWVCPPGTTPMDDCPPGSCFGLPFPGEVCRSGWTCAPWETGALPDCGARAERVCADCRGFEEAHETGACSCLCEAGTVTCGALPECRAGEATTPFGVTLRIDLHDCAFTRAELAEGVSLNYTIQIASNGTPVWSRPLDAGGCDAPDASGLRVHESITGDGVGWCLCDVGRCPGTEDVPAALIDGEVPGRVVWDGRSWGGPSDTGLEPGDPFPPGTYAFSVRAAGSYVSPDGSILPWDVTATAPITVLE